MTWWNRISLRGRIFLILSALVLITLGGGAVMIWHTYQMDALFSNIIDVDVASLQQVEELEIELMKQKGLVSYYFISGDTEWLLQLDEHRKAFRELLKGVDESIYCGEEKEIFARIESEYSEYIRLKDQVIEL